MKDPKQRLRDIGDARPDARRGADRTPAPAPAIVPGAPAARSRGPGGRRSPDALARWRRGVGCGQTAPRRADRAPVDRLAARRAGDDGAGDLARRQTIAYVAGRSPSTSRLYVRAARHDVDPRRSTRARRRPGRSSHPTADRSPSSPAAGCGGRRSPAAPRRRLAPAPRGWGGTWGADGSIVYVPGLNDGLLARPAEGGKPEQLTKPDDAEKGYAHVFPQALPGGDVMFTFWGRDVLHRASSHRRRGTGARLTLERRTVASRRLRRERASADRRRRANLLGHGPGHRAETAPRQPEDAWCSRPSTGYPAPSARGSPCPRRHRGLRPRQSRQAAPGVGRSAGARHRAARRARQITHATLSRDGRRVVYNGERLAVGPGSRHRHAHADRLGPQDLDRRLAAGRRTDRPELQQDRRLGPLHRSRRAAAS